MLAMYGWTPKWINLETSDLILWDCIHYPQADGNDGPGKVSTII